MNRLTRNIGPIVVVVVAAAAMLAWMWHRCPDPVVDFGRELYVPWRISEGQVLYRDLNYFNGPLSPYFNAMVFKSFGVSIRALKLVNAGIAIAIALLIYHLARRMGGAVAALVAGVSFPILFGCAHLRADTANFNFLTPYSHDLTHGIALSLLMIASLDRAARTRAKLIWLAMAGLLLGIVALTKAEVLLAAVVAATVGVFAVLWSDRSSLARSIRAAGTFIGCALVPPLVAFALLATAMPAAQALAGVAGTWHWLGDERLLRISFFRWTLGIDDPRLNIRLMRDQTAYLALLVVPAAALGWFVRSRNLNFARLIAIIVTIVTLIALGFGYERIRWSQLARPLPLFMLVIGIALLANVLRMRDRRLVLPLALTCFAGALLGKIILNARFDHYGFALSMPATIVLITALVGWIPRWIAQDNPAAAWIPRGAVLAAWGVLLVVILNATGRNVSHRVHRVGEGADAFLADERGPIVDEAARRLRALSSADETLTVMPEGTMLNYLSRRVNPTRYQNFLPAEIMLFDERKMLAELIERPPDWIALVHNDTRVYDVQWFGRDYARDIGRWVDENYAPATPVIGGYPFAGDQFGILLLKRKGVPRDTGF